MGYAPSIVHCRRLIKMTYGDSVPSADSRSSSQEVPLRRCVIDQPELQSPFESDKLINYC